MKTDLKKKFVGIKKVEVKNEKRKSVEKPEKNYFEELPVEIKKLLIHLNLEESVMSAGDGWIEFKYRKKPSLKSIPEGYFYKGGVAREQLRKLVNPNSRSLNTRDIDLVRFTDIDDSLDHKLSLEFMANDYEHGRGVEVAVNEEDYFNSRDITINEVLCDYRSLKASFIAIEDTYRNILRPSKHVIKVIEDRTKSGSDRFTEKYIDYRTVPKILRLAAERAVYNLPYEIVDFPEQAVSTPFDVALQLNRSLDVSESVGNEYLMLLSEFKVVRDLGYPPSMLNLVKLISSKVPGGVAFFRNLPVQVVKRLTSFR